MRLMTTRALRWKFAARFERGRWRFPTRWHVQQFDKAKREQLAILHHLKLKKELERKPSVVFG